MRALGRRTFAPQRVVASPSVSRADAWCAARARRRYAWLPLSHKGATGRGEVQVQVIKRRIDVNDPRLKHKVL
jgi:hypothetical protein